MRTNAGAIAKQQAAEDKKKHEKVQVLNSGPPPTEEEMIGPTEISGRDGMLLAPAVDLETIEEEAKLSKPVKRYRVVNGGRVQTQPNSTRTLVSPGKEIDELNFDIPLMRRQGIVLEDLSATS